MFYSVLPLILGLVALAFLFFGLRMLLRRGWLLGWLRGMAGAGFVFLASCVGLAALDLRSYKQVEVDAPIAAVSFEQLGDQYYRATFVPTETGAPLQFDLRGDQWQLDARIVRWRGPLRTIGGKPGFRLDRISGRYLSIEDQRSRALTDYSLVDQERVVDFWAWVYRHRGWVPWVDADYNSATFIPMADGALYEVVWSSSGLVAKPLNAPAQQAVHYWH